MPKTLANTVLAVLAVFSILFFSGVLTPLRFMVNRHSCQQRESAAQVSD